MDQASVHHPALSRNGSPRLARLSRHRWQYLATALLTLGLTFPAGSMAWAQGSFAGFAGNWRGTGQIMLDSGREAIRCRAAYAVRPDGAALNVDMTCASDSYRVHLKVFFVPQGSGLSGTWQETTRQVQGDLSGHFLGQNRFTADLEAMGVNMDLTTQVSGNRQSIALRAQGGGFEGADIVLSRR